MREGYGSRSVCVYLSVCYRANCYIPRLRIKIVMLQGSLWCSKLMICVDFVEKESFDDSNLLDFSDPGQLTFCINRTLGVSHYMYIRHRPNSYTHA